MEVEPVVLFGEAEPEGKSNNLFDALPADEGKSQSAALAPDAAPFVPATPPAPSEAAASEAIIITQDSVPLVPASLSASPEAAAAASAGKYIIEYSEFRKLKTAQKKMYKKDGDGPAHSSLYELKET